YVLGSGIALIGLAAVRGAFLWSSVGRADETHHDHCHHDLGACDHDHDHEHEHPHEETSASSGHHHDHDDPHQEELALAGADDNHGHDHDHGHSHSWRPWRYMLLCLPIILYFLNLPNQGFSSVSAVDVEESGRAVAWKPGDPIKLEFKEL